MEHMTIMMGGVDMHMFIMWGMAVATVLSVGVATVLLLRKAPSDKLLVSGVAAERGWRFPVAFGLSKPPPMRPKPTDTIFILPDISHYTKFMTGTCFSVGHAQHAIFSLLNAMITAADRTLELSKLEGDAALFYVDADRLSKEELGRSVQSIFAAFFEERERLKRSNVCPCRACCHIDDLDLKIFVHRGKTARFEFRGAVDHFGTDIIVLHRIMKNGVRSSRYLMVTDAAKESIEFPGNLSAYELNEQVEHVGAVRASIYEIGDEVMSGIRNTQPPAYSSKFADLRIKLWETLRSLRVSVRSEA